MAPIDPTLEYSIDGGATWDATGVFNIVPGTYTILARVIATPACVSAPSTSVTVNTPTAAPATPLASVTTQPSCGATTGTVTVSPTDPTLEYSIDGGATWDATGVFNIVPGTYTILARVIATPACVSAPSASVTVNNPTAAPTTPLASVTTQPSCGATTGTVTVAPIDPTLEYSIDGGATWDATGVFNIVPGTYTILARVIATPACVSAPSTSVTVNTPTAAPGIQTASVTAQPACGATTGTVTVAPIDPTLEYSIDGGTTWDATGVFNIVPGTYTILARVIATPACVSAPSASVTVNTPTAAPATPLASVTTQPACGATTGTVTVAPIDPTLEYSIDGGATWDATGVFNIVPGTYTILARVIATPACVSAPSTSVTVNTPTAAPATPLASVTTQPACSATTGTVTVAPIDPTLEYSIDGGATWDATGVFNIVPGTYTILARVIATPACVSAPSTSVTVNTPTAAPATPVASVTTQPACGATTGTVTVAPIDPTLEYSIDGGATWDATGVFNIVPGTYTILARVIATPACVSAPSASVTVNTPTAAPATPVASVTTQPACGATTGTVTVAPLDPTLEYSIDGGATWDATGVFNIVPGTYTILARVIATPACVSAPSTSVTVNTPTAAPATPVASVTTQPACGATTGTVTVAPIDPTLEYSIDGGATWDATGVFNIVPGTYTILARVIATPACVSAPSASVTVNTPTAAPATPLASVTTQPACSATTGTVTVAPIDPTLEYSIDGGATWDATGVFNIVPGTYTILARVIATPACVSAPSASVTVNTPTAAPATPVASVTTQPACGATTGTVTVAPIDPTLEYSIDGGATWDATGVFNVIPGSYTVIARSIATPACVSAPSTSVTVNTPTAAPSAPTATVAQPLCGTTTGTITVAPLDPTLEYSIDGGTTWIATGVFNLAPGTYTIIARSIATPACVSAPSASVTVNTPVAAPATPVASVTTQPSCGTTTGTITVAPLDPTLEYSIDGGTTWNATGVFNELPGNYTVISRGIATPLCVSNPSTTIIVNPQPLPTTSSKTISLCTASYTLPDGVVVSGSGVYTSVLTNAAGCDSTITTTLTLNATPQLIINDPATVCLGGAVNLTNPAIEAGSTSGLSFTFWTDAAATTALSNAGTVNTGGTYYVKATSAGGCSVVMPVNVTITNTPPLTITNPAVACANSTVDITTPAITAGSAPGLTYTYYSDAAGTVVLANPNAITTAATYYVRGTAIGGCSTLKPVYVTFTPPPTASISGVSSVCSGSNAPMNVTFTGTGPWTLVYSDGTQNYTVTSPTANFLLNVSPVGNTTYSIVSVSDAVCSNSSINSSATVSVIPVIPGIRYPNVNAFTNSPKQLTARTIGNDYSYSWSPSTGLDLPNIQDPIFDYNHNSAYLITLTSPQGCLTVDTLSVTIINPNDSNLAPNLFVAKAWTPNGDGVNDILYPITVNIKQLSYFRVYDRWGQLMYETNILGKGWDGVYNGQKQVMDVYTWTVEGIGVDGTVIKKSGNSLLLR